MNFELIGALKTAFEAEKEGMRNYLHFAKETKVAGGKDMFIQLALDEVDHMELIQGFMEKMLKGETFVPVEVPAGRLSKILPDLQDASRQPIEKAGVSDEQALKVGMEQEQKARDFYLAEADKAQDTVVKDFFKKLADVEQKHYNILHAELSFIQKDGFWFDAMEFSLEK